MQPRTELRLGAGNRKAKSSRMHYSAVYSPTKIRPVFYRCLLSLQLGNDEAGHILRFAPSASRTPALEQGLRDLFSHLPDQGHWLAALMLQAASEWAHGTEGLVLPLLNE
jgi:hypothetical protein